MVAGRAGEGQELRRQVKATRDQIISTRLRPLGLESLQQLYAALQQFNALLGAQFASGELPALIEQALNQHQSIT